MSTGDLIDPDGKGRVNAIGAALTGDDEEDCACGDCTGPCIGEGCPRICGTDNTCNKFCDSEYKSISRAFQCGCPCPGRRDFPTAYKAIWTGAVLKSGPLPTGNPSIPMMSIGTVSLDGDIFCDDWARGGYPTFYNPDGSVNSHFDNGWEMTMQAQFGACDCPDVPPSKWQLVFTPHSDGLAVLGLPFDYLCTANFDVDMETANCADPFDRCTGGILIPTVYSQWLASPGIITIVPRCRNCDGTQVDGPGDLASICGAHLRITIDISDGAGGSSQTHVYDLFGGPDSWEGTDQFGNSGAVFPASVNPIDPDVLCCPTHDPESCDCEAGGACPGCWTTELTTSSPFFSIMTFFGTGGCPNDGGRYGDMTVDAGDPAYSFIGDGCP